MVSFFSSIARPTKTISKACRWLVVTVICFPALYAQVVLLYLMISLLALSARLSAKLAGYSGNAERTRSRVFLREVLTEIGRTWPHA
jgi:hypothetical protein